MTRGGKRGTKLFSIVVPVKDEIGFLGPCLQSCVRLAPDEIIVATDKPADPRIRRLADKVPQARVLEVERNEEYMFHQAWVKRKAFRDAKHDRILVVDVDLVVTKRCLKAVAMLGEDVALVSLSKLFNPKGLIRLIRSLFVLLWVKLFPRGVSTTGLYAVYRPSWMHAESQESLKRLRNPKRGGVVNYGEDTHMFDSIKKKYRIIALRDIGCLCLSDRDIEDIPYIQFETGRLLAQRRFLTVFRWCVINMRPLVLKGYFYQRGRRSQTQAERSKKASQTFWNVDILRWSAGSKLSSTSWPGSSQVFLRDV